MEIGRERSSCERKGRRPSRFALNPKSAYVVGVDLFSQGGAVLLFDFRGDEIDKRLLDFSDAPNAEEAVRLTEELVLSMLDDAGVEKGDVLGIGIGVPGVVSIEEGKVVRYSRFPGMVGYPLREKIEEKIGIPVCLHNNTSLIAYSEYRFGRVEGQNSILAFLLRTGIGAAYIKDGKIFVSQGKTAFEAGHIRVSLTKREDASLEDFLSEDSIFRIVTAKATHIRDWKSLLEAIGEGDPVVLKVLSPLAELLAKSVKNIGILLNPEFVLVITRYQILSDFFAERVTAILEASSQRDLLDIQRVVPLQYDPVIACKGAASLVFEGFFSRR